MTRIGDQMTTATFAVLDKTFADVTLPAAWQARRDEAYSRGYLRAAAQSFTGGDAARGREFMREAVTRNPALRADAGEPVARLVAGWANYAKTADALGLLTSIYDNLPEELADLRRRKRRALGRQAVQMAWAARRQGDAARARQLAGRAVGYWPPALLDRGFLQLLFRTYP